MSSFPLRKHNKFHDLIRDTTDNFDIQNVIDDFLSNDLEDLSIFNIYFEIEQELTAETDILSVILDTTIQKIANSQPLSIKFLDALYILSAINDFTIPIEKCAEILEILMSKQIDNDYGSILLQFGIIFNICLVHHEILTLCLEKDIIARMNSLLQFILEEILFIQRDKAYFLNILTAFIKQFVQLILSIDLDENHMNQIWNFAISLLKHVSNESLLISCGFSILCQLLSRNFKLPITDEEIKIIIENSNESTKTIENIYHFITLYQDTELLGFLFENGLMRNIISILQQKRTESSIILKFLLDINYIPSPDDPIFKASIDLLNSQLTNVKVSAVEFLAMFLQKTPSGVIRQSFTKPPFLLLSSLIDESDLKATFASLTVIEIFLKIMTEEGIEIPSTIAINKILDAIDNVYGLDEAIDAKSDAITQILSPE